MGGIKVYFSDYFNINEDIIDKYGAVNISLINDIPLFIDPFLLFNSTNEEFQKIHDEMINYLLFLQMCSLKNSCLTKEMYKSLFNFSEVKQTWLGFSQSGNSGHGMGFNFAKGLYNGLNSIFKDFGKETITKGHHIEKLCLISPGIGRDKISDFTTKFAKQYLLKYTEQFARNYLKDEKCENFTVRKAYFDWKTKTWMPKKYYLPIHNGDYVLLTPKDMLTRDDTFINRYDMIDNLQQVAPSISDDELRFELNTYLCEVLSKKKKEMSKTEKDRSAEFFIQTHPELIDYYIKYKEDNKDKATVVSKKKVQEVKVLFNDQISKLIKLIDSETPFYNIVPDAHNEAKKRVEYLKHVIEEQDGYKLFYCKGQPLKREADLQIIYRLVWYGTPMDVNREVNNGRGPVDYKVSYGKKNSTLVEFKLASNSKLKMNLENQVDVYKAASETNRAIKVILFFSAEEEQKVKSILNELKIAGCDDIILIDARNDNKPSASNVK